LVSVILWLVVRFLSSGVVETASSDFEYLIWLVAGSLVAQVTMALDSVMLETLTPEIVGAVLSAVAKVLNSPLDVISFPAASVDITLK